MSRETGIEWTDSTFNCWMGCTNISPGCERCYAEVWSKRAGLVQWGNHPRRRTSAAYWKQPVQWNADAARFQAQHGRRQRVFCASLADWLDNQVDPAWRLDLLRLIDGTPQLDWLMLTKRPENARKLVPAEWFGRPNVWLGVTVEREDFVHRVDTLRALPAAIRFLSVEPLIGPVGPLDLTGIHWVIQGGESGPGARPMRIEWLREVFDQCRAQGVPVFLKQYGTAPNNPLWHTAPSGVSPSAWVNRHDPIGKGGSLLDGRSWKEFPAAARAAAQQRQAARCS
jgi:protein gp37